MAKGSGVQVPNFAALVAAKPIPVAPMGAIIADSISGGLGQMSQQIASNTGQQQQLLQIADSLEATDPSTAAIIRAQAQSIKPFGMGGNNVMQQIEPLLKLAQSKQQFATEMGLKQQEFQEKKLTDQALIGWRAAEVGKLQNANDPSKDSFGIPDGGMMSVTPQAASGPDDEPIAPVDNFQPKIADNAAGPSATGEPGLLPPPTPSQGQSPAQGQPPQGTMPAGVAYRPPPVDPAQKMQGQFQYVSKFSDAFQKQYGKSASESMETADADSQEFKDADSIDQMNSALQSKYGSSDISKAKVPQESQQSLFDSIPNGGHAVVGTPIPSIAMFYTKGPDGSIQQYMLTKRNGQTYVDAPVKFESPNPTTPVKASAADIPNSTQQLITIPDGKGGVKYEVKPRPITPDDIQIFQKDIGDGKKATVMMVPGEQPKVLGDQSGRETITIMQDLAKARSDYAKAVEKSQRPKAGSLDEATNSKTDEYYKAAKDEADAESMRIKAFEWELMKREKDNPMLPGNNGKNAQGEKKDAPSPVQSDADDLAKWLQSK